MPRPWPTPPSSEVRSAEHVDGGTSRFDKDGIVYQAVCAGCSGYVPHHAGRMEQYGHGRRTATWACSRSTSNKACKRPSMWMPSDQTACLEEPVVFNAIGNAMVYTWDFGDGSPQEEDSSWRTSIAEPGEYEVMLVGSDDASCNQNDTAYATVTIIEPAVLDGSFRCCADSDCNGYSAEFFNLSTGSKSFFWDFGDGTTSTQTNPVHPYSGTGDVHRRARGAGSAVSGYRAFDQFCVVIEPARSSTSPTSPLALMRWRKRGGRCRSRLRHLCVVHR